MYHSLMIYGMVASSLTHAFQTSLTHRHPVIRRSLLHHTTSSITTSITITNNQRQRSYTKSTTHLQSTPTTPTEEQKQLLTQTRLKCFRPTKTDVDRISYGKPAKVKGTGSRGVPHRLNSDERLIYDRSRARGFVEVIGSSYRRERRGSPLINTWRSWCDASGVVCVVLHKGVSGGGGGDVEDEVVVDLSPMRLPVEFEKVRDVLMETVKDLDLGAVLVIEQDEDGDDDENDNGLEEEELEDTTDRDDDESLTDAERDQQVIEDANQNRPIHQLSPYCISWVVSSRSNAKELCKHLSILLNTKDVTNKATKSRKPKGVKPGKNRRSGGYGIG